MTHADHKVGGRPPLAVLTSDQMRVYGDAIAALTTRQAAAARIEVELRRERLAVQAMDREWARIWVHICGAHGIDPEGAYSLDDTGQVFAEGETTADRGDNTPCGEQRMADYPNEVWDPYDASYPYRNADGSTEVNTGYMNARDNETIAVEAVLGQPSPQCRDPQAPGPCRIA